MLNKGIDNHIVESVKCDVCGSLHELKSKDYLSVHGNICVGEGGGIVGNNFDEDGRVNRISIFCKEKKCLYQRLDSEGIHHR